MNVQETEQVYRKEISPSSLLTVKVFANTEHSMLDVQAADSPLRALFISLFAPRQITVDGYMEEIEQFLKKLP
ncbi:hypothetical protein [Paenibacillus algorifonticola]|uniref:hypothetical protein n=1 Tax=Paenibacillus algorifonticola TaxID=684063 RepID=UPI00061906B6|nr:hypothetical protein [Paenibacillus algorifonticola]